MKRSLRWLVLVLAALSARGLAQETLQAELVVHHLYTVRGVAVLDHLGWAVSGLGDVDKDGYKDFVVGAPKLYVEGPGFARVVSGRTGLPILVLSGSAPAGGKLGGPLGDRFGFAVAGPGDVSGDGVPDVVVGAPKDDDGGPNSGSVYVFGGASGALLARFDGESGSELGAVVAAAGDVNGDGFPDILAGAPRAERVRVYSGEWIAKQGIGQLASSPQVLLVLVGTGGFGSALAGVGDVDGDGKADFAVGAPHEAESGRARVYSGASGALLHTFAGVAEDDLCGRSLAQAGDVDQDGVADVLVGATGVDEPGSGAGAAYVLSGRFVAEQAAGLAPSGAQVVRVLRGDSASRSFGDALSGAGDADADGVADVAVGAASAPSLFDPGYARVFSGQTGAALFGASGSALGDLTGWSLAFAGDLNEDGFGDLLVGVPRAGVGAPGAALALSGRRLSLASDRNVLSVSTGGTANLYLDAGAARAGHLYVVIGTASGIEPGIPTPLGVLPLELDAYSIYTLGNPPELVAFQGAADGQGRANPKIVLPADSAMGLVGFHLDYACVAFDLAAPDLPLTFVTNSVPLGFETDSCDVEDPSLDCDGNGILDACDIAAGRSYDCNANGRPDECDLASGASPDIDRDGVPDECTQRIYVDAQASGAGTGTSWADAHTELRVALDTSPQFAQIWVAQGTYKPWPVPGNRGASFFLRRTVGLYGGFAGGETSLDQRDPVAHETILSGDLAGDDLPGFLQYADNSWSVLTAGTQCDATAVLDGFSVRGGSADETLGCDVFAIYFSSCRGGGLYNLGSPTIRRCVFRENYGGHHGGAIYSFGAPTIVDCVLEGNRAFRGGGLYNDLGSRPLVVGTLFRGNNAILGGGMFSTGELVDVATLDSCAFVGNGASERGGAIYSENTSPLLVGCTLASNAAWSESGGVFGTAFSSTRYLSCILWNNQDAGGTTESAQLGGGAHIANDCCIQGWSGVFGAGSIGLDPLFVDLDGEDGVAGSADDDLRLAKGSPCIDRGDTLALLPDAADHDRDGDTSEPEPLDLDRRARVANDSSAADLGVAGASGLVVDLGAYERQP